MKFRHEWKHEVSPADLAVLRRRLGLTASPDSHGDNGRYRVRSLYFDTPSDRVLREKLDGAARREKYRIRFYDGDLSVIHLEKKTKDGGLCSKESVPLAVQEVQALLKHDLEWMACSGRGLVWELRRQMVSARLRPRVIVDYMREAFVYAPGNVRVTLDHDIRTGLNDLDFLNPDSVMVPARAPAVLEVKWDAYLPDLIRDAVQLEGRRTSAFSKYAVCRRYG